MADYPGAIKAFVAKSDDFDIYYAAHINDLQAEVEAIETELGTDPAAAWTDLKTRLLNLLDISNLEYNSTASNITLADSNKRWQRIDNTAAIDLILPANASTNHAFTIRVLDTNDYPVTVKNNGGTVICVMQRSMVRTFIPTSTSWEVTGLERGYAWIPAAAMVSETTNGAASGTYEASTNKQKALTKDFDSTTGEYVDFTLAMPPNWNGGSLRFKIYWGHGSTTTNFGVTFRLALRAYDDSGAFDDTWGYTSYIDDTGGTAGDIYITDWTTAKTPNGSPAGMQLLQARLLRAPAQAGDTLAIDAQVLGVMMEYSRY